MGDTVAIDMFVVATATFRLLYTVIVLGHDRRRIIHFDVTQNPTQVWLARQITEAFPWDTAPQFLLRDRDRSYGQVFRHRICMMGIKEVVTAARSPWQNAYVERIIGSVRRKCLDHVIIFVDVAQKPTQVWLAHQITEAFPWDTAPRFLLRDRDRSYGQFFAIASV
jgi:hypothetical protein